MIAPSPRDDQHRDIAEAQWKDEVRLQNRDNWNWNDIPAQPPLIDAQVDELARLDAMKQRRKSRGTPHEV